MADFPNYEIQTEMNFTHKFRGLSQSVLLW